MPDGMLANLPLISPEIWQRKQPDFSDDQGHDRCLDAEKFTLFRKWVLMTEQSECIAANNMRMVSPSAALRDVQKFLAEKLSGRFVRIYEAGGGSASVLPLSSLTQRSIVVVDIDEVQLQNNKYADDKILGDIQTYLFPPNSFDLIVCYNVIEHLAAVDQAIERFYHALAPGGVLFIGAPNPESLFGMVTKYSPHWFHVWFYRVILRRKEAGKPGQVPFRTVYHPIVAPKKLLEFSAQVGFQPIYLNIYIGDNYTKVKNSRPIVGWLLSVVMSSLNVLTFNKLDLAYGDYHVVLQKPTQPAARPNFGPAGTRVLRE